LTHDSPLKISLLIRTNFDLCRARLRRGERPTREGAVIIHAGSMKTVSCRALFAKETRLYSKHTIVKARARAHALERERYSLD